MSTAQSFVETMKKLIAREVAPLLPSWRWGQVVATDPVTIDLDAEQGTLSEIGSLVSGLAIGDRVQVLTWGTRSTITGIAGGGDTGWVDAPLEPDYQNDGGTAGRLQFRRRGGTVFVRGGTDGPRVENAYTTVATIPDGFPAPEIHHRVGVFGGGGRVAGLEIGPDRTIKQVIRDPIASTWISASTSYPAS